MIGINQYRNNATQLASPQQLVMMLFETVLRRLDRVEECLLLDEGDIVPDLHRIREILLELNGALDFEAAPEVCSALSPLYQWMLTELISLGSEREVERLHGIRGTILPLAEGWRGALEGGRKMAVGQ